MNELVRITGKDMVAVALKPLKAGERVSCGDCEITLAEDLPMGHKAALRDIKAGEAVIRRMAELSLSLICSCTKPFPKERRPMMIPLSLSCKAPATISLALADSPSMSTTTGMSSNMP